MLLVIMALAPLLMGSNPNDDQASREGCAADSFHSRGFSNSVVTGTRH
jgi:hypothetical protein